MVRVFIAIDLPPEVRERIAGTQRDLVVCDAKLSPVDPSITHLTLKFIGEVDDRLLESIREVLPDVGIRPFSVAVAGVSANNPRRPRVVWTDVIDRGESAALHHAIEDRLAPLGISREKRAFTPHITLARVRRFDPSLLSRIEDLKGREFGSFEVAAFSLKKSTLTPKGPLYEDIMEVRA